MKKLRNWLALFPGIAVILVTAVAHAALDSATTIPYPITQESDITALLCSIIGYFFWFIIALSVIMALWAAFTYLTAGDDTEKTSKARKILTYAAVGIIVALIADGFPSIIAQIAPNNTLGTGGYC